MATKANLLIDQGSTFTTDINLTDDNGDPISLVGYSANSEIKKWYTSRKSIPFTTYINVESGTITLSLDANTTSCLTSGRYVYDVIINNGNNISRIVEGIITVDPAVTREY